MSQHAASPRLSHLGNQIVAMMAHEAVTGGRLVRLQLLASQFYEAVKAELDQTPRHEAAKVSALAATADQCRRLAQDCRSPHLIRVEVRAAVAMLSAPPPHQSETVVRFRPQLRVIQGGLA